MKSIKKRIYKILLFVKNFLYIQKNIFDVKNYLNADKITFASFGGADINFYVKKNKKIVAMMRLAILDTVHVSRVPINRFNKNKRIQTEISAYKNGGVRSLTPELLYYSDNFTVCKYLDGDNLNTILKKEPEKVLTILNNVLLLYKELHKYNIIHLDASLKNVFIDNSDFGKLKVVDFEYYPDDTFSLKEQKLYDYLRIYEYVLRKVKNRSTLKSSINLLENIITDQYNNTSLVKVSPLLDRLKEENIIMDFLECKNIEI